MKLVTCRDTLNVVDLKKIKQFEIQKLFVVESEILMMNLMNEIKRLKSFIKKVKWNVRKVKFSTKKNIHHKDWLDLASKIRIDFIIRDVYSFFDLLHLIHFISCHLSHQSHFMSFISSIFLFLQFFYLFNFSISSTSFSLSHHLFVHDFLNSWISSRSLDFCWILYFIHHYCSSFLSSFEIIFLLHTLLLQFISFEFRNHFSRLLLTIRSISICLS